MKPMLFALGAALIVIAVLRPRPQSSAPVQTLPDYPDLTEKYIRVCNEYSDAIKDRLEYDKRVQQHSDDMLLVINHLMRNQGISELEFTREKLPDGQTCSVFWPGDSPGKIIVEVR